MLKDPLDVHSRTLPLQAWYGGSWVWEEPAPQADPIDPNALGPLDLPGIGPPDPVAQEAFGTGLPAGEGTGLVLGRFLPPHRGHQYLLDFAQNSVSKLYIGVRAQKNDSIPIEQRLGWLREMAPRAEVVVEVSAPSMTSEPDEPGESIKEWAALVRSAVSGVDFNYFFGSEPGYATLAGELAAELVLVDPARSVVAISASQVRDDPLTNWVHLPPCVRPHYVRKVVILGPEASGKSTLARQLAWHYGTVVVPEYARILLSDAGRRAEPTDIPRLARGQRGAELALARQANRVLFCDGDLLGVALWSERMFGACPDWVRHEADRPTANIYLVTAPDVPYQGDPARHDPARRQAFHDRCIAELSARNRPFVRIQGGWDERFDRARQVVDDLLGLRPVE